MVAKRIGVGLARHLIRFVVYGLPAISLALVVAAVFVLDHKADLEVWHTAPFDAEFTRHSGIDDFAGYLAAEQRLFDQLTTEVQARLPAWSRDQLNRFDAGSRQDPGRIQPNWNRSFEWPVADAPVAVLLVHGMSDSPYSVRSIAEQLHAGGAHVLALRVPGHGVAPADLARVDWQDMAAAVDLAARHLRTAAPGAPLVFVGYSNGAALSVRHTLEALEQRAAKRAADPGRRAEAAIVPDALVLLSPAIGITPLAPLAFWQERLGNLTGLPKLQWNSIAPEYDPYKYNSFPLHAAQDSYELTVRIRDAVGRLVASGGIADFPPTLAFQSLVDATVSVRAVVDVLFGRLDGDAHDLTIFDVRRGPAIDTLMKPHEAHWLASVRSDDTRSFPLTVVTNEAHPDTREVDALRYPRRSAIAHVEPTGARWPADLYSLSHVALPFPPDDPVYGGPDAPGNGFVPLGEVSLRGEKGVLQVSGTDMLRLRWNPFHGWMLGRIEAFVAGVAQQREPSPARAGRG